MKAPGWQNVVTSGNFLSIAAMLLAVSGFYFDTRFRLDAMERFRIERTAQTDRRFDDINKTIAEVPQLSYRVTKVEAAIEQISSRIDSGFSTFSARLDRNSETTAQGLSAITAAISALDTRVAVLTQRLETLPNGQRAELHDRLKTVE